MIISKTPYRISFFGGSSDYPEWYNTYKGTVISSSINKYLYISFRKLPNFFTHKYRIVWSKIENVKKIDQIQHKVIKHLLKINNINDGLEIHYDGDLPARSGMGSSSSFVVGCLNSFLKFKNKKINKFNLANNAINFEQNILKENVGSQDQVAAAYGGFNRIDFYKNNFKIKKIKSSKNLKILEKNLMLIYTNINRTADNVAGTYVKKLKNEKKNYIDELICHANEAEKILEKGNIDDFGKLLHSSWILKKKLSKSISNNKIDELYDFAIKNGAYGGKILGAGAGGFLLFYIKNKDKKKLLKKNKKIIEVPFEFSNKGSEIIFNGNK